MLADTQKVKEAEGVVKVRAALQERLGSPTAEPNDSTHNQCSEERWFQEGDTRATPK